MLRSAYLFIGLFAYLFIVASSAQAHAEGSSISIAPANFQIRATAPADIRAPFTITNKSGDTVELKMLVKSFTQSTKQSGQPVLLKTPLIDERAQDAFLQNVLVLDNGFAVADLTLAPKQEKKLFLSITINKDMPPQDHYFSLLLLSVPGNKLTSETKSFIQTGISLPVLLSIGTNKDEVGFIDDFSVPFFMQSGPVPFSVKIKNTGTHFISPRGAILIKNLFGQTVGRIDLPTTSVLAGTSRYLRSNETVLSLQQQRDQDSSPKVVWPEKFLFGFYTANLMITMSDNTILYTRTLYFTAFPFTALIVIFLFIYVSFLFVRRLRKKLSEE